MPPFSHADELDGFWGKSTSTLDWCEENYVTTFYIAEFWNTISNVVMIVPPFLGCLYYWKIGMELRYIALTVALLAVGIGSWFFHMTLKYEMQLLDELPMIYGTTLLTYVLHWTCKDGSKVDRVLDIVVLITYCLTVSLLYIVFRNPLLHQVFYGCIVFTLVCKTLEACKKVPQIRPYAITSFLLYAVGFFLWNIDNIFCSSIRHARGELPLFLTPTTQLHAWWHLFTGTASWIQFLFTSQARAIKAGKSCTIKMLWHVWPYLDFDVKED